MHLLSDATPECTGTSFVEVYLLINLFVGFTKGKQTP